MFQISYDFTGEGCAICPGGSYSTDQTSNLCVQCEGIYVSKTDRTGCDSCVDGEGPDNDQTFCVACDPGWYSNASSSFVCTECPIQFRTHLTNPHDQCLPCPGGEAAPDRENCVSCEAAYYSNASSDYTCEKCPETFTSSNDHTKCVHCANGFEVAEPNRTACVACTGNGTASYEGTGFVCDRCPAGLVAKSDRSGCVHCPNGQGPDLHQETCVDCASYYYSNASTFGCSNCSKGYVPNSDGSACEDCPAGQRIETSPFAGGFCAACPVNHVAIGPGAYNCTACDVGWYPNAQSNGCLEYSIFSLPIDGELSQSIQLPPGRSSFWQMSVEMAGVSQVCWFVQKGTVLQQMRLRVQKDELPSAQDHLLDEQTPIGVQVIDVCLSKSQIEAAGTKRSLVAGRAISRFYVEVQSLDSLNTVLYQIAARVIATTVPSPSPAPSSVDVSDDSSPTDVVSSAVDDMAMVYVYAGVGAGVCVICVVIIVIVVVILVRKNKRNDSDDNELNTYGSTTTATAQRDAYGTPTPALASSGVTDHSNYGRAVNVGTTAAPAGGAYGVATSSGGSTYGVATASGGSVYGGETSGGYDNQYAMTSAATPDYGQNQYAMTSAATPDYGQNM